MASDRAKLRSIYMSTERLFRTRRKEDVDRNVAYVLFTAPVLFQCVHMLVRRHGHTLVRHALETFAAGDRGAG